ncbi:putative chromo/chromo shadow domain, Chromo-like domain superfamily protein [Plasmopara halstedii]
MSLCRSFTTWLRLMERLRDVTEISRTLQRLLTQQVNAVTKLQDIQHKANLLSATDKTLAGLVTQINESFFWDIVPALKRARQVKNAQLQRAQDSLDRYLELGDEEMMFPQNFAENMLAFQAHGSNESQGSKKMRKDKFFDTENDTDDDIQGDKLHDMLVANRLKLTTQRAHEVSNLCFDQQQSHLAQGNAMAHASDTVVPPALNDKVKCRTNNQSGRLLQSIETDLTARSDSRSADKTPTNQSESLRVDVQEYDRIHKRTAVSLVAKEVLRVRTYRRVREFLIRWEGVESPLWIVGRKAPPQAKKLIELYALKSRTRGDEVPSKRKASPRRKRKTIDNDLMMDQSKESETADETAEHQPAALYNVDHIVNHRVFNNSKQYLVRWENYDESEDTWEDAYELRVDVPDIVDAYEEQICRLQSRSEEVQVDTVDANCNIGSKLAGKKRSSEKDGFNASKKGKKQLQNGTAKFDDSQVHKKQCGLVINKEDRGHDSDMDYSSDALEDAVSDDSLIIF